MAESLTLPDFTPVPLRARRDGWTAERQRGFIAALVETRSPTHAARAVGMTREGAHALRRRADASSFAAAWDAALARACECQPSRPSKLCLYERAVEGVVVPYFYGGLQRGEYRRYDDGALLRLLRRAVRLSEGKRHV